MSLLHILEKNYSECEPTGPIEICIKNMCKSKESMRRYFYENFQTYSFTAVPLEEHFHISMIKQSTRHLRI